jgi:hypothetical protein
MIDEAVRRQDLIPPNRRIAHWTQRPNICTARICPKTAAQVTSSRLSISQRSNATPPTS